MDGYVNSINGAAGCDESGQEGEEAGAGVADCSGHSDSELMSLEGNLKHMGILDDDLEQPDGQRSSLSLEDDGGTHFEPHSQETVVRRGMPVRDVNAGSPTMEEGSDDNDVVFYPAQKLNFDDDGEDDDDDEDNDNEGSLEVAADIVDNNTVGTREYIPQRPIVNGSDTAEPGAYSRMPTTQDQGQNVRIIEGHDSSLLDDGGNSTFGFNFLHTQMVHMPLMSPGNLSSGLGNSSRLEDEGHNLYDSLEREDGSSLYGETDDHIMESNSSEYFSAGNMSLVVANSQVPDCDLLWAQDDSSDHGSYLPHPQQHFQGGQVTERNFSRHHSPPRNFQVDASSVFASKRRSGFVGEGNMGGYGDVHGAEEDNTDALTLELSEEGLSQSTQMYAQPVSASNSSALTATNGNSACKGDMGMFHQQTQNDWTNNRLSAHNNNQLCLFDNATRSVHQGASNVQPKNLIWSQGIPKDESKSSSHVEGDGVDIKSDERQSGPGGFSISNQKPACDTNQSGRRSVVSKIQTRRPAVQGSASSGDNKRSGMMNSRQGSVPSRKVIPPAKSGSHNDTSGRSNAAICRQNSGGEQVKGNNGALSAGNTQSRTPQGQMSALSMTSRSNSHTSLASNVSSTNSRVGGVGKESHMSTNPQASRTAPSFIVKAESNHPMTMAQRLAGGKGDTAHAHSNGGISQQQHSNTQFSNPSDRMRPTMDPQSEPHKSQSFTKQCSTGYHPQNSPNIRDNVNEPQNCRLADPQHPNDIQHHSNNGSVESNCRNPQNQIQQYQSGNQQSLPVEYSIQQMSHQSYQTGFPIQVAYTQGCSPSGSEGNHHSSREVVVTQMETFKRQGPRLSPVELNSQRSHLDNDIQGMEEVRSHLHSMLNMGAESSMTGNSGHDHTDASTELLFPEQSLTRQLYFDSDTSSFIGNSHQDDMSDILENFPTFSSKMFSHIPGISNKSDAVSHGENQYLRECLEKEKYRRKHCEEHIHKQNAKLLELQQQLAVAVSTDKRKDLMIEQLDKQLAKVVEGWKKRETEKDDLLKVLSQEKEQLEESLQSQQTTVSSLERKLSQTTKELREEKEKFAEMINSLKAELYQAQEEKQHFEEALKEEQDKHAGMKAEWNDLKESKELAEKGAQLAQERLIQEQENWLQKEQELSARITEMQESHQRILTMEKVKYEELKKRREEAEGQSDEMKTELEKMILDMEQLIREKESQKVEMAIMEAKFESAQRKLEADLHAQMEKEIGDQAAEFHSRIETSLEEAADRYHKQMAELQSRHQHDLERQAATLNEERQKKEDNYRKQLNELEEKLQELRAENLSLGQSKIKLESQRMEILTKLQYMMQSQWNEAVSLLVTTPQKKSLNSSFLSSQSGEHLVSTMPGIDRNTSLSLVNSGPATFRNQESEGQGHHESSDCSKYPPAVLDNGKDERQEEMDRMDRVEEYLQRLPHNMGIPVMRNDISASRNEPHTLEMNQNGCPTSSAVMAPNNSAGLNYSNAVLQHHSSTSGFGSGQESGGDDFRVKPPNNLSQSRPPNVHGYVAVSNGQGLTTSSGHIGSGHMTKAELRCQAVAMRSPQQSSSRYSTDSSHHSAKAGTDHPSAPPGQQYILNSYPGHGGSAPPAHQQRCHTYYPHEQKSQSSLQPNSSRANSSGHGAEMRLLAGDFGDHKQVKMASGSAANVNLYRPDSPTYISSPASIPVSHWSLSSGTTLHHYTSVPSLTSAAVSSPARDATRRPLYSVESPVKRHKPRTSQQQARHADEPKESLSPPVKQKAERDHSDTASDVSSGGLDANRLLVSYSQLSQEHHSRQGELQHYVRMLLQKAPGSMCSEPERDQQFSDPEILESSRDLTVDLDLNDTATAAELTSQLTRLQHLREREQQLSRAVPCRNPRMQQVPNTSQSNESILSHLSEFIDDTDIISSQRLSEISKLLNLYRDSEIAGQASVAGQLLDALKDASVSSSTENISKKGEKRTQIVKNSPKSQQTRKVKDVAKTQKIRSESQSADTSVTVTGYPPDSSTSNKQVAVGPPRKLSQPTEAAKDKKAGSVKQAGGRSSGGPAWK